MTDTNGPLCLTHLAPDNAYTGHLLFYDIVPPSAISRSGVLSSILEAGGADNASLRLPDFVTLAEFKLWSSTITAAEDAAECKDIAHACTVLKAADALDDHCFKDWLQVTVSITRQRALAHHRSGAHNLPDDISAALSSLPDHLHHRVLELLPCPGGAFPDVQWKQCSVNVWLDLLPCSHHLAIAQGMISPDKRLAVWSDEASLHLFAALAKLPVFPPSLLSIHVDGPMPDAPDTIYTRSSPLRQKRDALAAALRHHSSLTSLHLKTLCDSDSMQTLAPAIATLTALKELRVGCDLRNSLPHSALPHLKVALDTLSCLEELKLVIGLTPRWEFLQKRVRDSELGGDRPHPQLQYCLGSVLCGVTSLTALDIDESWGHWRLTPTHPLSLPCLQHLNINSLYHNVASVLLSQLSAPLSGLVIRDTCGHRWSAEDMPIAQRLWAGLPKFVQLRSLDIRLGLPGETAETEDALLAGAPAALASLVSLEELQMTSDFPVLLQLVQQLALQNSGLRRFFFSCGTHRHRVPRTSAQTWQDLLSGLSRLPLQYLYMGIQRRCCDPAFPGLTPLQPLTQLTALRLDGWRSCLRTEEDCEALAGMQQLRGLCIDMLAVPGAVQADFVRTLGALPSLIDLALVPDSPADGLHAAFIEHAPGAAWPALQSLTVAPVSLAEVEAFAQAVAGFPAFRKLMLIDDDFDPFLVNGEARDRIAHIESNADFVVDDVRDLSRFDWTSEYMYFSGYRCSYQFYLCCSSGGLAFSQSQR